MVTDIGEGGTLYDLIELRKGEPMSQDEILDIFLPLVEAI